MSWSGFAPKWTVSLGIKTWIAAEGGKLLGGITILNFSPTMTAEELSMSRAPRGFSNPENPVCNLGSNVFTGTGFGEDAGSALLSKIAEIAAQRGQMAIVRVLASDNEQQILFEKAGFVCVGFQPDKHFHRIREEVLYYVLSTNVVGDRRSLSSSLPQLNELASAAMANLQIPDTTRVDDGGKGYPLKTDIEILRVNVQR
jgi:hypothetical protein